MTNEIRAYQRGDWRDRGRYEPYRNNAGHLAAPSHIRAVLCGAVDAVGQVEREQERINAMSESTPNMTANCRTFHRCDGEGWVRIFGQNDLRKQPCTECYGTGYIVKKETNDQRAKSDDGKLEINLVPMKIVKDIAEVRMDG